MGKMNDQAKRTAIRKERPVIISQVHCPDGARRMQLKCGQNLLVVYVTKTGRSMRVFTRRGDELRTFGGWKVAK
jgi:hypothetical protein